MNKEYLLLDYCTSTDYEVADLLEAARQGDAEAQYALGEHYDGSSGYEALALWWYHQAAKQNHLDAWMRLADDAMDSENLETGYSETIRCCLKIAELGCLDGISGVGDIYFHSAEEAQEQLKRDGSTAFDIQELYLKAIEWYLKASEQGDTYSCEMIGDCYSKGLGVTQSFEEAQKWYQRAEEYKQQQGDD